MFHLNSSSQDTNSCLSIPIDRTKDPVLPVRLVEHQTLLSKTVSSNQEISSQSLDMMNGNAKQKHVTFGSSKKSLWSKFTYQNKKEVDELSWLLNSEKTRENRLDATALKLINREKKSIKKEDNDKDEQQTDDRRTSFSEKALEFVKDMGTGIYISSHSSPAHPFLQVNNNYLHEDPIYMMAKVW